MSACLCKGASHDLSRQVHFVDVETLSVPLFRWGSSLPNEAGSYYRIQPGFERSGTTFTS